jgi:hypothetical protein
MDFKKDYYKILEVSETATKEEIKASYRRLVKLHHPDSSGTTADERIKLINEAKDVLANDLTRSIYDEYRKAEKEKEQKEKEEKEKPHSTHQRSTTRKRTVTKESRIYIRGTIVVKYYGEQEEQAKSVLETETHYRITPTEAIVTITETDIYRFEHIPSSYNKSYTESQLFSVPLPQPVKCIVQTATGETYYQIELRDIRIRGVRLAGVTKHEGQSFGELHGEVFAYTPKFETEEVIIEETECYGATGQYETKTEDAAVFVRQAFFNPDCSRFWGEWKRVTPPGSKGKPRTPVRPAEAMGCLNWWWIPVVLLFLFLFPRFFLGLLGIVGFGLGIFFIGFLISLLKRIIPVLAVVFVALVIFSAIRAGSRKKTTTVKHDTIQYDTLRTSHEPLPRSQDTSATADTVINHFISWNDYDTSVYAATLSVLVSDVKMAGFARSNTPFLLENSLAPVYHYLEEMDTVRLSRVYSAFDSIRTRANLDQAQFAKMVVSCIQSIPYYLVLDQDCDASRYNDEFIYSYLSECNKDCCIGNIKYGVRSPVEFMGDLKGDCDTRALTIYSILKHFRYNVALLTSSYYKHAVVAVHFDDEANISGRAMNIHDKNYYLWETTSKGFRPGQLAADLQNLYYWDIALLTENH